MSITTTTARGAVATISVELQPAICKQGGSSRGYLFPAFGDDEAEWGPVRIPLYLFGLLYAFLGVGVASDAFMSAIEAITSKRVRRFVDGRWVTAYLWNATVSNLSLMALGSSAPEILLNVLEISLGDFYAGDLGPSTIVGSAAFNMFVIIGVCVFTIDSTEVRKIKEIPVYCVTATFSIFAYLWLVIILALSTPNIVEIWEAVVTLLFFPLLLILAYLADRGYFGKVTEEAEKIVGHGLSKEELATVMAEICQKHGANLKDDQIERIIAAEYSRRPTRAARRVEATRFMTAGQRVLMPGLAGRFSQPGKMSQVTPIAEEEEETALDIPEGKACISFEKGTIAVLESANELEIKAFRTGDMNVSATVKFKTREGTASQGSDYIHKEGEINFAPGEEMQTFTITMVDDQEVEDDEEFYVDLVETENGNTVLGKIKTLTCVIIDDDIAGVFKFPYPNDTLYVCDEFADQVVDVAVERRSGSCGVVGFDYRTEDDTALAGPDYVATSGKIQMPSGEIMASIPITIKSHGRYDQQQRFRIILDNPTGSAKFCDKTDGGEGQSILTVVIYTEEKAKGRIDRMYSSMRVNIEKTKVGHANWKEQFRSALMVNGGDDDKDGNDEGEGEDADKAEPSVSDYIMHAIACPWKLLFAFIPPTDYCGGWLCFFVALLGIGFVTLMISELASLLGCVMCMPDAITAITFVALGTSLPDTFASMSAAQEDPHADASVGNVTGSNSVNVFLGLGLPWTMASIYWAAKGKPEEKWLNMYGPNSKNSDVYESWWENGHFVVIAGDLSISVVIFSCCAAVCIATLALRRRLFGGELGGPWVPKVFTSALLISLWLIYVIVSSILVVMSGKSSQC